MSYIGLITLSQVVGQIVVDVGAETAAVLRVQLKDLPQSPDADVLQVAVGQRLHVGVGLDHLVVFREVGPDEVAFTCRQMVQHLAQVQAQCGEVDKQLESVLAADPGWPAPCRL